LIPVAFRRVFISRSDHFATPDLDPILRGIAFLSDSRVSGIVANNFLKIAHQNSTASLFDEFCTTNDSQKSYSKVHYFSCLQSMTAITQ
jgi:hypothetical protein